MEVPPKGFALAVVLGLMILLGLLADTLFLITLNDNCLVAKNGREMQERFLGYAGMSWIIARASADTTLVMGTNASVQLDDSNGFYASIKPMGLFIDVRIKPQRGISASLQTRSWMGIVNDSSIVFPVLSNTGSGDIKVRGNGEMDGEYFMAHGLLFPGAGNGNSVIRMDSNDVQDWMKMPWKFDMVSSWQKDAERALLHGNVLDSEYAQKRSSGSMFLTGNALIEKTELHVRGLLTLRDFICRQCIILADSIRLEKGLELDAGLLWAHGSLIASKANITGYGQVLANDTLTLDTCKSVGRHLTYASIGRSILPPIGKDSVSSGFVSIRRSHMEGNLFSLGIGSACDPRLKGDSMSTWEGIWAIRGRVEYSGIMKGQTRLDGIFWRAPNGVIWNGQTDGHFLRETTGKRIILPVVWSGVNNLRSVWWRFEHIKS